MPRSRSSDSPHVTLRHEITAIVSGEHWTWAQIGHLLDRVDKSGYWQSESSSFTAWLKERAGEFGVKESTLWRYLTAGRYYVQLRKSLSHRQVTCPPLENLSDTVSPENLELLSKLSRAAPDEVIQELAVKVIHGDITRAELRTTWQAYRPVLDGRTARGGIDVPCINLNDRNQWHSQLEAMVLTTLSTASPEWTGVVKPEVYELIMYSSPLNRPTNHLSIVFDAVVVVRENSHASLKIHGIEIKSGGYLDNMTRQFETMAPFCDAVWLATPASPKEISKANLPDFVGVMRIDEGNVIVERFPGQSRLLSTRILDMTQGLLLKTMKH